MRVLLDTNILIHREASRVHLNEIGILFNWLDKLGYEKWVHYLSLKEIENYQDDDVVKTMKIKISNYNLHKFDSPETPEIIEIRKLDKNLNDEIDTSILKEVYSGKFDILLTQDKKLFRKSKSLGIDSKVFNIDTFLGIVTREYPELTDYKVLSVRKDFFGNINLNDPFFDSFKHDYLEFENWFKRKSETEAYICETDNNIRAFLFLKVEPETENYINITPNFSRKKRLKIGTFKVESTGLKLGERFLKIIFDNALNNNVDEIYVTIFDKRSEQLFLIDLLEEWGFCKWGIKETHNGTELVYVRPLKQQINLINPKITFPMITLKTRKFIVPIYPEYHTNLMPDSILNNESPIDFIEDEPFRNAIKKVYVSRSVNRNLTSGDLIIFYRTGGLYKSVITTIGIVESVIDNIEDEKTFMGLCRKRTVLDTKGLKEIWSYNKYVRPFVVNFLQVYSFPIRINMKRLIELGVIKDINTAPRGFEKISDDHFKLILKETKTNENFIID